MPKQRGGGSVISFCTMCKGGRGVDQFGALVRSLLFTIFPTATLSEQFTVVFVNQCIFNSLGTS